jgi:uncharacterized protein CbrC (UPF0167 family)
VATPAAIERMLDAAVKTMTVQIGKTHDEVIAELNAASPGFGNWCEDRWCAHHGSDRLSEDEDGLVFYVLQALVERYELTERIVWGEGS